LVLAAASARAADVCFQDGLNSATLVMKGFKFPNPGDCKPITGFEAGNDCLLTRTPRGAPPGPPIRSVLGYTCMTAGFGKFWFSTDRTYFSGDGFSCQENLSNGNWTCPSFPVWKVNCPITFRPATSVVGGVIGGVIGATR